MINLMPLNPAWSADGFPPIKMSSGYSQLLARIQEVTGTICKLSNTKPTPGPTAVPKTSEVTFPPFEMGTPAPKDATPAPKDATPAPKDATPVPKDATKAPEGVTFPPFEESTPAPQDSVDTDPPAITTFAPGVKVTSSPTTITFPPKPDVKPCHNWGHLHMDFGGDIAKFGDAEQVKLTERLAVALHLKTSQIKATRHTDTDNIDRNLGALGHGKIF